MQKWKCVREVARTLEDLFTVPAAMLFSNDNSILLASRHRTLRILIRRIIDGPLCTRLEVVHRDFLTGAEREALSISGPHQLGGFACLAQPANKAQPLLTIQVSRVFASGRAKTYE